MTDIIIVICAIACAILILAIANLRIVPQSKAYVMERLGIYSRTWHTGLHIKWPFIERAAKIIDLKEQILVVDNGFNHNHYHNHGIQIDRMNAIDREIERARALEIDGRKTERLDYEHEGFALRGSMHPHSPYFHHPKSQPVITKDNVSMEIDTVVFYQVTDCKLFAYGHANPVLAVEHLTATTLRNIIGELELDQTLTSRDYINGKMRTILDEATDPWGIKVTRVELKNIIISDKELSEAMEKQMIAERTRRERIIEAEGIRKAAILKAEGEKQAAILEAEGKKQAAILEAEGEAEAILARQQATAEGIKMINASEPTHEVLTLESLKAFENAANGQSNTIIIPSEIQSLAGLAKSAAEVFKAE